MRLLFPVQPGPWLARSVARFSPVTAKKPRTAARKGRSRRASARTKRAAGASRAFRWIVAVLLVLLVGCIGLLAWTRTPPGRAALLRLGADKFYGEVQANLDEALVPVLPGFVPGPAGLVQPDEKNSPIDFDWPQDWVTPGAAIRCRLVAVAAGPSFITRL